MSVERTQEEEYPKKPGPYLSPASFTEVYVRDVVVPMTLTESPQTRGKR